MISQEAPMKKVSPLLRTHELGSRGTIAPLETFCWKRTFATRYYLIKDHMVISTLYTMVLRHAPIGGDLQ